jgi:hypothetical protein
MDVTYIVQQWISWMLTHSQPFMPRSDVWYASITRCGQISPWHWRNTDGVMSAVCEGYGNVYKFVIYTTENGHRRFLIILGWFLLYIWEPALSKLKTVCTKVRFLLLVTYLLYSTLSLVFTEEHHWQICTPHALLGQGTLIQGPVRCQHPQHDIAVSSARVSGYNIIFW